MATFVWATIVKSNARYQCQKCGSTELLQAHDPTTKHTDTRDGICLCAECHSQEHPEIPRGLFFNKNHQPYWGNISASSLAKQWGKHPRTIYRIAKKLNIPRGFLAETSQSLIKKSLSCFKYSNFTNKSTNSAQDDWLSVKEVARRLDANNETILRWLWACKLKGYRAGKIWRIKESDLNTFLKPNKQEADTK